MNRRTDIWRLLRLGLHLIHVTQGDDRSEMMSHVQGAAPGSHLQHHMVVVSHARLTFGLTHLHNLRKLTHFNGQWWGSTVLFHCLPSIPCPRLGNFEWLVH